MSTPRWQPGHLYPPGSLVVPRTAPVPGTIADIPNAGFESGDLTGWTVLSGNWVVTDEEQGAFEGQYELTTRHEPEDAIVNDLKVDVRAGDTITVSCMMKPTRGSDRGTVRVYWYDEDGDPITPPFTENPHNTPGHIQGTGGWRRSSLTTQVPTAAKKMAIGCWVRKHTGSYLGVDLFQWNYPVFQPQAGLLYKAVQAETGYSNNVEPEWPGVLGQTVVDNEVTWEAVAISRVVWEARPILRSGATEPTWPTESGANVADNTISWEAVSRRVEDEKCPQSKHVVIAASKVFAGDEDIIAYSATVNPLDWSSPDNAGYLPFGLQLYGANPVSAMGLYRGNVVAFNVQGGQVWQVDEDPALMQLLDAFPIGTQYHHSLAPVTNDLFMLTQLGVRTLGVAAGSTNLQAGDVGMPIDPMVQAALAEAQSQGYEPFGLYNPNAGQYWLAFTPGSQPIPELSITGDLPDGRVGDPVDYTYLTTGGLRPYRFRIVQGELPTGTTMDPATSRVTGEFTVPGFYSWRVQVEDRLGNVAWVDDTASVLALTVRFLTTPPYAWETVDGYGLGVELGRVQNISTTSRVGEYGLGVELAFLTLEKMQIQESAELGEYGLGVEFAYMSNSLARIGHDAGVLGEYEMGVEFAFMSLEETRVALDRHSPNEYGLSVELAFLENIEP